MAEPPAARAWAELWLISDLPINESQLRLVQGLFGEGTTAGDIRFWPDRHACRWPLHVADAGNLGALSSLVWTCAGFLTRRRAEVERLHASGCNLELCLHAPGLLSYFSLAAGTMKLLADLEIQFSLVQEEDDSGEG